MGPIDIPRHDSPTNSDTSSGRNTPEDETNWGELTTAMSSPIHVGSMGRGVSAGSNDTTKRVAEAVKRGIGRDQLTEALQNINAIIEAVQAVSDGMSDMVKDYENWKRDNCIFVPLVSEGVSGRVNIICGRCEFRDLVNQERDLENERLQLRVNPINPDPEERVQSEYKQRIAEIRARKEVLRREHIFLSRGRNTDSSPLRPPSLKRVKSGIKKNPKERASEEPDIIHDQNKYPRPYFLDASVCPSTRSCKDCWHQRCSASYPLPPKSPEFVMKIGSTSKRCIDSLESNSNILHITPTHLALKYTLKRIICESGLPSQKDNMKFADQILFGIGSALRLSFKLEDMAEMARFWTDLDRVLDEWGWLILFARPDSMAEVRELCRIEVDKASSRPKSDGVLEDYNARLITIGPRISAEDFKLARLAEEDLVNDIMRISGLRQDEIKLGVLREAEEKRKHFQKMQQQQKQACVVRRKSRGEHMLEDCREFIVEGKRILMGKMRGRSRETVKDIDTTVAD